MIRHLPAASATHELAGRRSPQAGMISWRRHLLNGLVLAAVALTCLSPVLGAEAPSDQPALDPAQRELDEIFALLAMAVVYKDWQTYTVRGHNIAAILVDPANRPVFWARNDRFATGNGTEHGEVRLIRDFLDCPHPLDYLDARSARGYPGGRSGQGFTLYTTLDPCVMCTGMMLMTRLYRAVYVQSDPDYGSVAARLAASAGPDQPFPPYPVSLDIVKADLPEARLLDEGYRALGRRDVIIPWLRSEPARRIFAAASERLRGFESAHGNQGAVEASLRFLDEVVDAGFVAEPATECPAPAGR